MSDEANDRDEEAMMREEDESLQKSLDLEAWGAEKPPSDFAARAVALATSPSETKKPIFRFKKERGIGLVVVGAALAAGVTFAVRAPAHGEMTADVRKEIAVGPRATLVLEPGAKVSWSGSEVTQERGDVFYRVERGGAFRVHGPGGVDVEVKGTCFRIAEQTEGTMKRRDVGVGVTGAAIATAVLVSVYEGKVIASQKDRHVTLEAGQSARADEKGLSESAPTSATGSGTSSDEPTQAANATLADQVRDYKRRLEKLDGEKEQLATRLKTAESQIEKTGNPNAPPKNEFDLSKEDWAELAEKGAIKIMAPCQSDIAPTPSSLSARGLAPADGAVLSEASRQTHDWLTSKVKPLCLEIVGRADIVDKLSPDGCFHLAEKLLESTDDPSYKESFYRVAEIKAGTRPRPQADDKVPPFEGMMLALVDASSVFESKLAEHYGPDEAHRIVFSERGCSSGGTWTIGPRKKK